MTALASKIMDTISSTVIIKAISELQYSTLYVQNRSV